jgi:hypothetical protein
MSQYIPGIVDYIPQIQPYKPNLNFYQQVLETKNAQYKEGYQQISNLYGNLLESPMLRTENLELRNKFFNQISSEIAKISGLDLSLSQNVNAAQQVFQPLVDNKYILKDMAYTKRAYSELDKAERFKNCTDEKTCGGKYWDGGVRLIQYQMEDFSKSSAEDSLGFDAPKYVPAVNIGEKAMKFAKDMGFNMQTVSWSPDGRYIVKTKNGTQMIPHLTDAFLTTFQNDQGARDYYAAQGTLTRKDFSNAYADQYGSVEAAESFYLDDMAKKLFENSSTAYENTQKDLDKAKNKQTVYDQVISQRGIDPDDPDDQKIAADRNQALVDQMISQSAGDQYKQTQEKVNPGTINIIGLEAKRKRIDAAMADALFTNDLSMSAQNYAMLTMEQTVDEDKYMLANYDHQLTLARMKKQRDYDIEVDNAKTANELFVKSFGEGANGGTFEGQSGDLDQNEYQVDPGGTGKGGAAEDANLQKADESAFSTSSQIMLDGLDAYAKQVNERLNTILTLPLDSTIPGSKIKVTPELKKWAKDQRLEIFGQASVQKASTSSVKVPYKTDAADLISMAGTGILGAAAEYFKGTVLGKILGSEKETKIPEKITGGYLDADGNLIDDLSKVEDFTTNPQNDWFQLGLRLNNFAKDPYTAAVLGDSIQDVDNSARNYARGEVGYNAYLTQMKENKKAVHGATIGVKEVTAKTISPEHAKRALGVIYSNGKHMTEDEFVNWYADNGPKNIQKPYTSADYRFGTTPENYSYGEFKTEARDLYKRYKETYEKIYNGASDAPDAGKDLSKTKFKPLVYAVKRDDTGAGVEGMPMVISVDSAHRGNVGARDFVSVYENLSAVPSAKFYAADGRDITADYLDDSEGSNDKAKKALALAYSHLKSGKTKKDNDRARFKMSLHPVLGNNAETVGITFNFDEEFMQNNQGSEKNPKALRDSGGVYTVVMNREDAKKLGVFQKFEKGIDQVIMDAYGVINFSEYDKAGSVSITPSSIYEDGLVASGYLNYYKDGVREQLSYNVESGPGQTADTFAPQQRRILAEWQHSLLNYAEAIRSTKPNLIKDGELLMK